MAHFSTGIVAHFSLDIYIHRDKPSDGWIHVSGSQVIEAEMAVKELAGIQVFIGGIAGFVKQIPKGIVRIRIRDDVGVVGEGAGTAEAVRVVVRCHTGVGPMLGDQIMAVHITH